MINEVLKKQDKKNKKEKLTRKKFLSIFGLGFLGGIGGASLFNTGIHFLNESEKRRKKEIYYNIYNELKKCVHFSRINIEVDYEGVKEYAKAGAGYGIILDDKYITVAHLFDLDNYKANGFLWTDKTPFPLSKTIKFKVIGAELYGKKLEKLVLNYNNELAIFKLHKDLQNKMNINKFPCKLNTKISLGDKVYMIGNPHLSGDNIRAGIISDLDGTNFNESEIERIGGKKYGRKDSFFGVDMSLAEGDSGSPIVNEDYELLGFVSFLMKPGTFGYVKRIEEFLKEDCMKDLRSLNGFSIIDFYKNFLGIK